MGLTTDSIERTLQVWRPDGKTAAGFTIDRHSRQWIVTAAHVVADVDPADVTVVSQDGVSYDGFERVPTEPKADIAVFSMYGKQLTPHTRLVPTAAGNALGQDVYFLGFPFGWSIQNGGARLPFVKKAIVSGRTHTDVGTPVWIFDGMNVEGFSGGPIVFRNAETQQWQVMGVVHGYQTTPVVVHDVHGDAVGAGQTNTGFFIGFDISYATDAIDRFVKNVVVQGVS